MEAVYFLLSRTYKLIKNEIEFDVWLKNKLINELVLDHF